MSCHVVNVLQEMVKSTKWDNLEFSDSGEASADSGDSPETLPVDSGDMRSQSSPFKSRATCRHM